MSVDRATVTRLVQQRLMSSAPSNGGTAWPRLEALLASALDLPPEERESFLDAACAADPALRAEVAALLAASEQEGPVDVPAARLTQLLADVERTAMVMQLEPGGKLGPYVIVGPLGAGGMGEVYRARDTRLDREVALKIVAPHLQRDAASRARLDREARIVASLSHPNIVAVYDVGNQDGTLYLVTELLTGHTLRELLGSGPLDERTTIELAVQIAHGLSAAHDRQIVHRDLKPENLFVTREGVVKILDFGLAKPREDTTRTTGAPEALTAIGARPGTAGYMAPEQVRGEPAGPRADIFALGIVIFEMLSGVPPFKRDTSAETLTAILKDDPPALPVPVSPALERLMLRCLQKRPQDRFHLAHDLSLAIEAVSGQSRLLSTSSDRAAAHRRDTTGWVGLVRRGPAGWIAAAALAATLLVVVLFPRTAEVGSTASGLLRPLQRLAIDPGAAVVDQVELSRDGTTLAYLAGETAQELDIYVQSLASLQPTRLEGTLGAATLAFSPNGDSLVFTAGGNLFTIPLTGGRRELLVAGVLPWPVSWEDDGFIYYTAKDQLRRVPEAGGQTQPIDAGTFGRDAQYDARLLPDKRTLLFGANTWKAPFERGRDLVIRDEVAGVVRSLSIAGVEPEFMPPRFLLFSRWPEIYAQTFDPASAESGGPPQAIEFGVQRTPRYEVAIAPFSISRSGDLAFVYREQSDAKELLWVERDGRTRLATEDRRNYGLAQVSPDGSRLAVTVTEGPSRQALWILDLATLAWQKPGTAADPRSALLCAVCTTTPGVWTPDSRYFTFPSAREGPVNLFHQPADFVRPAMRLVPSPATQVPYDWSPDGRYLLFADGRKPGIWVYDTETGEATPPPDGKGTEFGAPTIFGVRFHPSGRWIAHTALPAVYRQAEPRHVFIRPFPGPGAPRQVGADRGYGPAWSRDGKELYFRSDTHVMSVPVDERGDQLVTGQAVRLFEDGYLRDPRPGIGNLTIHPGGQFLMTRESQGASRPRIVVVQNLRTRLEQLFPQQD